MADAGAIYAQMGVNLGNMITGAAQQYHQEHLAYDQQMGIAEALNRMAYNPASGGITAIDPLNPDKSLMPLLDKKTYETYKTDVHAKQMKATGALEAVNRIAIGMAQHAITQGPKYPTQITPGGPSYPLTPAGAASVEMQKERYKTLDTAAAERAKASAAAAARAERGTVVSEKGLTLREKQAAQQVIANAPETKFQNDTGVSPQLLISPDSLETGYQAVNRTTGEVVGEISPLKPGETLKDMRKPPAGWGEYLWQTVAKNRPATELDREINFVPKPGGAFRVAKYEYGASQKTGQPKETKWAPNPEGEYLQIGDKRIKFEEATKMRGIAEKRRADALDALKQGLPVETIKTRLAQWGYDPNDKFWKLP